MTATKTRSKVCPSCRIGRCAECTRPGTCECAFDHRALKKTKDVDLLRSPRRKRTKPLDSPIGLGFLE